MTVMQSSSHHPKFLQSANPVERAIVDPWQQITVIDLLVYASYHAVRGLQLLLNMVT